MIFENIENKNQQQSEETQQNKTDASSVGIIGDSTTHAVAMTRLWVNADEVVEKIEIQLSGQINDKDLPEKFQSGLAGKKLSEVEFLLDYKSDRSHKNKYVIPEIIYESFIRAIDNYHTPRTIRESPSTVREPDEEIKPEDSISTELTEQETENKEKKDDAPSDRFPGDS